MALIIVWSTNFIEISLDGLTDFDAEVDLTAYGLARNAPSGLRIRKIVFHPSDTGDILVVRDGKNGPMMFAGEVLGTYDRLKDEYREDGKIDMGKLVSPYIHANELTIGVQNQAYVVFEL